MSASLGSVGALFFSFKELEKEPAPVTPVAVGICRAEVYTGRVGAEGPEVLRIDASQPAVPVVGAEQSSCCRLPRHDKGSRQAFQSQS